MEETDESARDYHDDNNYDGRRVFLPCRRQDDVTDKADAGEQNENEGKGVKKCFKEMLPPRGFFFLAQNILSVLADIVINLLFIQTVALASKTLHGGLKRKLRDFQIAVFGLVRLFLSLVSFVHFLTPLPQKTSRPIPETRCQKLLFSPFKFWLWQARTALYGTLERCHLFKPTKDVSILLRQRSMSCQ